MEAGDREMRVERRKESGEDDEMREGEQKKRVGRGAQRGNDSLNVSA